MSRRRHTIRKPRRRVDQAPGNKEKTSTIAKASTRFSETEVSRRDFLKKIAFASGGLIGAGVLGAHLTEEASTEEKAEDKQPLEHSAIESPVIVPTEHYETRIFGNRGPIIYIFGWDHDGGPKLKISKEQLLQIISNVDNPSVNMVIEGFYPPGKKIEFNKSFNRQIRDLLNAVTLAGVNLWAGEEEKPLLDSSRFSNTLRRGTDSTDDHCMRLFTFETLNMQRTSVLLKSSLDKKLSEPNSVVIGCMGDGHFEKHEQIMLNEFANSKGIRIVLYATKGIINNEKPDIWPEDLCGQWKDARRNSQKSLLKIIEDENISAEDLK